MLHPAGGADKRGREEEEPLAVVKEGVILSGDEEEGAELVEVSEVSAW